MSPSSSPPGAVLSVVATTRPEPFADNQANQDTDSQVCPFLLVPDSPVEQRTDLVDETSSLGLGALQSPASSSDGGCPLNQEEGSESTETSADGGCPLNLKEGAESIGTSSDGGCPLNQKQGVESTGTSSDGGRPVNVDTSGDAISNDGGWPTTTCSPALSPPYWFMRWNSGPHIGAPHGHLPTNPLDADDDYSISPYTSPGTSPPKAAIYVPPALFSLRKRWCVDSLPSEARYVEEAKERLEYADSMLGLEECHQLAGETGEREVWTEERIARKARAESGTLCVIE